MSGKLYLCPTPIGNLEDITIRVLNCLKEVDLIAAEDTRVSMKLLQHFGIQTPTTSYYEHNKREKGSYLLEKLKSGQQIAVITDAGMPGISDPGEDLVRLCIREKIPVEALPGPCAFATALVASGLPTGRFSFEGFLSMNKRSRTDHLNALISDTRTLIFYEAPHKLLATLRDMYAVFQDREIVLAREITKRFEEYRRTTLAEAITYYEENPPKGEFVLILSGADPAVLEQHRLESLPSAEELIRSYAAQGLRAKELTRRVAEELKQPKRDIYDLYLRMKDQLLL